MAEADDFKPNVSPLEARRALDVRRVFMEALLSDPRVVRGLTRWFEQLAVNHPNFDVLSLVQDELGLRWPWCAVTILQAFHQMIPRWTKAAEAAREAAGGGEQLLEISFSVEPSEVLPSEEAAVHAPPLGMYFETTEDEGADEAAARLTALYEAAMAELVRAQQASGGRSSRGEWGRWFYEARVAQPPKSINAIAKQNHVDRKTVRAGIRTAEQLLSLGAYAFPPGVLTPEVSHR
jgi:hypothetical protein